jgi:hypothetical protein
MPSAVLSTTIGKRIVSESDIVLVSLDSSMVSKYFFVEPTLRMHATE